MATSTISFGSRLTLGGRAFWAWWTHEISAVADDLAKLLTRRRRRTVLMFDRDGRFTVASEGGGQARPVLAGQRFDTLAAAREAGLASELAGHVVVRVAAADTFSRTVELPRAAAPDAAKILGLDLIRNTPFRPADVYTTCTALGSPSRERVTFRQIVVKRALVEPALAALRAAGSADVAVECEAPDGNFVPLALAQDGAPQRRWGFEAAALAGMLTLVVAAMALEIGRLTEARDQLAAQTAEARTRAEAVRTQLDRAAAAQADADRLVRFVTDAIPRVVLIEELTRLLPDTTWLVDLRIDDTTIVVSGLAPSAADLVPLLQKSTLLREPALAAPVTFDPREQRERFSIRAQLAKPIGPGGG